MSRPIIATTTFASYEKGFEQVRAECALRMVTEAVAAEMEVVVVDGGSPDSYVTRLQQLGARVVTQESPGMGNARRQALAKALELSDKSQAIIWTEPEKYPLMPLLSPAACKISEEHYDLVMLRRLSLESYPPEQAMAYQLIALAVKYLTGIDSDFGWGPTALSASAVEYYLDYQGDYGDSWDSIHIPKLRIIHDNLPWTIVDVDYSHPPEQTAAETGMALFSKRIKQIDVLVTAIQQEVEKLDMGL